MTSTYYEVQAPNVHLSTDKPGWADFEMRLA
jgi:hypothetical protein